MTTFDEHDLAAIVGFIPTDGVEHELVGSRAPVTQRLTVNDIVRHFGNEGRYERIQSLR